MLPYFIKDNANFANIFAGKMNTDTADKNEILKTSRAKYDSYNYKDWDRIYFDELNGGFNVYHKSHSFSKKGGGGDAEKTVGKMLAKYNGKQVEFLPESSYQQSPDINFDSQTWDIKLINNDNEGTIQNCIRRTQGGKRYILLG